MAETNVFPFKNISYSFMIVFDTAVSVDFLLYLKLNAPCIDDSTIRQFPGTETLREIKLLITYSVQVRTCQSTYLFHLSITTIP